LLQFLLAALGRAMWDALEPCIGIAKSVSGLCRNSGQQRTLYKKDGMCKIKQIMVYE
jgi:hypothetical protein